MRSPPPEPPILNRLSHGHSLFRGIRSAQPIVAYMAHFDSNFFGGFGTIGYGLDEGTVIN